MSEDDLAAVDAEEVIVLEFAWTVLSEDCLSVASEDASDDVGYSGVFESDSEYVFDCTMVA